MHIRAAIRTALTVALAATYLAAPAAARPAAADATETAPAGVPATTLLAGPAPTTVTTDSRQSTTGATATDTLAATLCADKADGTLTPAPCPPASHQWTPAATFVILKQPNGDAFDQAADTGPGAHGPPALRLLRQLLPRADLRADRATPLDPRPA